MAKTRWLTTNESSINGGKRVREVVKSHKKKWRFKVVGGFDEDWWLKVINERRRDFSDEMIFKGREFSKLKVFQLSYPDQNWIPMTNVSKKWDLF